MHTVAPQDGFFALTWLLPALAAADDLQGASLPNEISCSAAISACEQAKQWEKALRELQLMTCRALA